MLRVKRHMHENFKESKWGVTLTNTDWRANSKIDLFEYFKDSGEIWMSGWTPLLKPVTGNRLKIMVHQYHSTKSTPMTQDQVLEILKTRCPGISLKGYQLEFEMTQHTWDPSKVLECHEVNITVQPIS